MHGAQCAKSHSEEKLTVTCTVSPCFVWRGRFCTRCLKLQALAERRAPQCSSQIPREKGRKIKDVQIDLSLVHTVLPRLNGQHGSAGAASVDAT